MAGKQAKVLSEQQIEDLLVFAQGSSHPHRNQVIILLSVKARLRAVERAGDLFPARPGIGMHCAGVKSCCRFTSAEHACCEIDLERLFTSPFLR